MVSIEWVEVPLFLVRIATSTERGFYCDSRSITEVGDHQPQLKFSLNRSSVKLFDTFLTVIVEYLLKSRYELASVLLL